MSNMYKIISALFLIVLGDLARAENQNVEPYINSTLRTEDYINMNRQQFAKYIEDFDIQMELFKQLYTASLDTINIQQDMLVNTLVQTDDELMSIEIQNPKCVSKYRPSIPAVIVTKAKINNCITTANQQFSGMLNINAHYYIFKSQKDFAVQMDVAECSSEASINKALDCSYLVEKETISAIAEAKTLINKCLESKDDCKPCIQGFTCSEVHKMPRSEVSYTRKTMNNPFYLRSDIKNCLMLQLY
ncbi:uncharacterized protein LOC119606974 [Lucilia sericata]|uniref:uncharacterized protein LOC119606974 n=1 Tax=Lucilia sericata TaxID=13632 RepID=UPI0018A7F659|nr:uncharacterized protein LOC119606974 [Lucilia sericata]